MHLEFAPKGILQIDDARVIFKNFEGRGDKFNREGDRNFSLIIEDTNVADALTDKGWNVKIRESNDPNEAPFMRLPVKIKFSDYGPNIYLKTGEKMNRLDENTVGILDNIDWETCDMDIRPFDWEVNGNTGRTAYLQSMCVTQRIDRFAARYANVGEDYDM